MCSSDLQLTKGFLDNEKMKVMLLFKLDAQDPGFDPPLNSRGVDTVFKPLKKQMALLEPVGARDLIAPLKETRAMLYCSPFFAGPLMEKRGQILDRLGDEDFISLIVDLVLSDCRGQVARQLAKRRKQKGNEHRPVFDFCHIAFEYMGGQMQAARKLEVIAEKAGDRLKEIGRAHV